MTVRITVPEEVLQHNPKDGIGRATWKSRDDHQERSLGAWEHVKHLRGLQSASLRNYRTRFLPCGCQYVWNVPVKAAKSPRKGLREGGSRHIYAVKILNNPIEHRSSHRTSMIRIELPLSYSSFTHSLGYSYRNLLEILGDRYYIHSITPNRPSRHQPSPYNAACGGTIKTAQIRRFSESAGEISLFSGLPQKNAYARQFRALLIIHSHWEDGVGVAGTWCSAIGPSDALSIHLQNTRWSACDCTQSS